MSPPLRVPLFSPGIIRRHLGLHNGRCAAVSCSTEAATQQGPGKDYMDEKALIRKYRLSRELIYNICQIVEGEVERPTQRSQALIAGLYVGLTNDSYIFHLTKFYSIKPLCCCPQGPIKRASWQDLLFQMTFHGAGGGGVKVRWGMGDG